MAVLAMIVLALYGSLYSLTLSTAVLGCRGRYDERDFDDMVTTLRGIGAWLVDASPDYVSPF